MSNCRPISSAKVWLNSRGSSAPYISSLSCLVMLVMSENGGVFYLDDALLVDQLVVKGVHEGIDDSCQHRASLLKHVERFVPHGPDFWHEDVGDWMKYQVVALALEGAQVSHAALHRCQFEVMSLGDRAVVFQLPGRVVEHRDAIACSRQYRHLLSPARCQTQDIQTVQFREPVSGHVFRVGQQNFPYTTPSVVDNLIAERNRPLVAVLDSFVPGCAVVYSDISWVGIRIGQPKLPQTLSRVKCPEWCVRDSPAPPQYAGPIEGRDCEAGVRRRTS